MKFSLSLFEAFDSLFKMWLKVVSLFLIVNLVKGQSKCPVSLNPPTECFSPDDIKNYGPTSKQIETLYNNYVNLLTEADLNIDGDEVY